MMLLTHLKTLVIVLIFLHMPYEGVCLKSSDLNLIIYENEDKSGVSVPYWDNFFEFESLLTIMVANQMETLGLICVENGIFVIYEKADYWNQDPENVRIISGINKCASPASHTTGSIRHAASKLVDPRRTPHITVFDDDSFGGNIYTVVESSNRDLSRLSPIKSFIVVGRSSWTVVNKKGDAYCLVPMKKEKKIMFCVVPNTKDPYHISQEDNSNIMGDLYWTEIYKGCEDSTKKIELLNCFEYDIGEIQGPAIARPLPKNNSTGPSTNSVFDIDCAELDDFVTLLRMRLTHNFHSNYQVRLPEDKKHAWRTELLDVSFDIAKEIITPISPAMVDLLLHVREFYIYFAEKKVWSQGHGWPKNKPTYRVKAMIREAKQCLAAVQNLALSSKAVVDISVIIDYANGTVPLPEDSVLKSEQFQLVNGLDPLMEFIWLIINAIGVNCHYVKEFTTNFWIDYFAVANDMYLTPMVEQWLNPGRLLKYYPILFGGYEYLVEYHVLTTVTTYIYSRLRYMELFPRPMKVMESSIYKAATAKLE